MSCRSLLGGKFQSRSEAPPPPRAIRSSGPLTHLFLCFLPKYLSRPIFLLFAERVPARSKRRQIHGKTPILEESAEQRNRCDDRCVVCRFFKNRCFSEGLRRFLRAGTRSVNGKHTERLTHRDLETDTKLFPRAGNRDAKKNGVRGPEMGIWVAHGSVGAETPMPPRAQALRRRAPKRSAAARPSASPPCAPHAYTH